MKFSTYLTVILLLIVVLNCTDNTNSYSNNEYQIIDSLKQQIDKHKRLIKKYKEVDELRLETIGKLNQKLSRRKSRDTIRTKRIRIVEEENIQPANIIDLKIIREIPRAILDTLRKEYPNFYIPKANRCKAQGKGDLTPEESPFYIWGDFNNDLITDYAFYMEFYGVNRRGIWVQEQRIIILSSKETKNKNKVKYDFFDLGGGRGVFSLPIGDALVKLSPQKDYYYNGKKLELDVEKILYLSFENEVGALLEWDREKYKMNYLWNTL
ncbi:MAG: hypothetical protein KKF62_07225 [Bacteroidetes bacterium]|nr:hypothetical protein [Bacteroidota bacterium]MBU1114135.1 hypothetical protein [Bacteroidota bacterium]MBU1796801.1 hypothetical protein [Bacteroidota bacterium]